MAAKAIPPELTPDILAKAGEGLSAQKIADWLKSDHRVVCSGKAVQRLLAKIAKERAPIAQAVVQEKLAKTITADLDAVNGVLERARAAEEASGERTDFLQEIERIALTDIAEAFDENGQLLPIKKMPLGVRRAIASVETETEGVEHPVIVTKVKLWDKNRALDLLGRLRASLADKDTALKARDQQLRALELRLKLAGAGGDDEAETIRARLKAKLESAKG